MPKRQKLYADTIKVTKENGQWVARFYLGGFEMWSVRPKENGDAEVFVITGIHATVQVEPGKK